jgi:methionyl-tRNA synthetase
MIKKCECCNVSFEPTNGIQRFCKVCAKKRKKEYNLNHYYLNKERYMHNNKQWVKDNPDKVKIIRDRSYKNNPDIYKKCSNEYRTTHQ